MGTNPVNGNNGQADKSNGLRFRPQQPQVSQEVKDAANPVLKFKVQQQEQNQKALNDPQAYLKDQEKIKQAQEEWAKLSDEEKAEKHKRSEKAKAQFEKEQEAAAKERAEHSVVRMADGTVREGVQKPVGEVVGLAALKGLLVGAAIDLAVFGGAEGLAALATRYPQVAQLLAKCTMNGGKLMISPKAVIPATLTTWLTTACTEEGKIMTPEEMVDWYNKRNNRSASAEAHSYSESFSTALSDAYGSYHFENPYEPIEGNCYDHAEDILYALFNDQNVLQSGMVEACGLFKCFDNVLKRAQTDKENSVKSFTYNNQLVKGKQIMSMQRTDNPGESNETMSNHSVEITEAATGLKLVTIKSGVTQGTNYYLAVALDKDNNRVYMYPYLSDSEETELNSNPAYNNAAPGMKKDYRNAILADKMEQLAENNGYTRCDSGAKDGNSSNGVYTYFEKQSNGRIVNYIVTPTGTWSQIAVVEGGDNEKPFMDNDDGNNLKDQHDDVEAKAKNNTKTNAQLMQAREFEVTQRRLKDVIK